MVGILNTNDLLNYQIILGKLCTWHCRRNKSVPKFNLFLHKVETKQETERLVASRNRKLQDFRKRWEPFYIDLFVLLFIYLFIFDTARREYVVGSFKVCTAFFFVNELKFRV